MEEELLLNLQCLSTSSDCTITVDPALFLDPACTSKVVGEVQLCSEGTNTKAARNINTLG